MGKLINVTQDGKTYPIDEDLLPEAIRQGFHVEGAEEAAARIQGDVDRERLDNPIGKVASGGFSLAQSATGGGLGLLLREAGVDPNELARLRDVNPGVSTATGIVGALLPTGAPGLAAKAGARAGRVAEGAGSLAQIGGAARGGAVEGIILGTGQGAAEFALSDDLSIEQAASVIGSNALFGAATGGVIGGAGKAVEKGLAAAKSRLDKFAAKGVETGAGVADDFSDLTRLDRKGLRAAEKAELDAIEAARVPKRSELASEIRALRSEMKEQKLWLATKDADVKAIKEVREIGKTAFEADKAIDRMLRNPKALEARPQRVLDGLQQQEHALERLVAQGDNLRPIFAKDASGTRAAALDYASVALDKNRTLQAKIAELTGRPTSARLEAIQDAVAGLSTATKREGATVGDILGQAAMGHAVGALAGVPYLGQAVLAAKAVGGIVKKLGADTTAAAARGSQAIQTFLDVGAKVAPRARVLATKTLTSVGYGAIAPERETKSPKRKEPTLVEAYKARSSEIRALTAPGPDGAPIMRMDARAKMAERLAPIRAASPLLADRIETNKARAIEFLASKLPRKPDLPGMGMGDGWQPSDMEMRGWARYVAAVEDPHGIVERLATGEITPEDAEAMRTVYPEMYAQIQAEIMMQLGELRAKLPYQRRLALSIFSGVPVDPAMDPRVLAILQGSFAAEEGTGGGVQAPQAQPAFGSVTKEQPTPAQERAAG